MISSLVPENDINTKINHMKQKYKNASELKIDSKAPKSHSVPKDGIWLLISSLVIFVNIKNIKQIVIN